jgi:hypothetical protein
MTSENASPATPGPDIDPQQALDMDEGRPSSGDAQDGGFHVSAMPASARVEPQSPERVPSESIRPNSPHAPLEFRSDGEGARRASRGIQEHQVWAAANALLIEGLNPTIERVRQKLGRGSPNTVNPMLARWFAALGARLAKDPGTMPSNATEASEGRGDGFARNTPEGATDFAPEPERSKSASYDETSRRGPRGVQEHQVWEAADMLLIEGQRPTIERVRQKLGGGSPNTVSPMLERWFSSLGPRLIKEPVALTANTADVSDKVAAPSTAHDRKVPPVLATFAQKLWEEAQMEARKAFARHEADIQASEQRSKAHFEAQSAQLRLEQASFAQARGSLESALASAHQALQSMQGQLEDAVRSQHKSEREVAHLKHQLAQVNAEQEMQRRTLNQERAEMAADSAKAATQAADREKRLLAEVERERSATRRALADLLKGQEKKLRAEEELARARNEEQKALSESRAAVADLQQRLALEEQAHQVTRNLLAAALVDKSHGDPAAGA